MGVSVGALARKVVTLKGESYGTWMENGWKMMEHDGQWMDNGWTMMENGWNMMENYGTLWKMMENDGK
jgi:hypothetical protein